MTMNFDHILTEISLLQFESTEEVPGDIKIKCWRFQELFGELCQKENESFEGRLSSLGVCLRQYARLRPLCHDEAVSTATQLGHDLFVECARVILGVEFQRLPELEEPRLSFKNTLDEVVTGQWAWPGTDGAGLSVEGAESRKGESGREFHVLQWLMEHYWSHSTLVQMMKGEDLDNENAMSYLEKVEHPTIFKLRIEMLVEGGCESYALNLCNWSVRSSLFSQDVWLRQTQLLLLHKFGRLQEFHNQCWLLQCCTALRVVKDTFRQFKITPYDCTSVSCCTARKVMESLFEKEERQSVCLMLAQTFLLQDWMQPQSYCCTKELLRLWIQVQRLEEQQDEEFLSSVSKVANFARSTRQIASLINVMCSQFGTRFCQFCTEQSVRALRMDRHKLDSARISKKDEEADAAADGLARTCRQIAYLYDDHLETCLASLVTALYLDPKTDLFYKIETIFKKDWPDEDELPDNVDEDVFKEMTDMIEALRPACFSHRSSWTELRKMAIFHLEEAGYRYDVTRNKFRNMEKKFRSAKAKEIKMASENPVGPLIRSSVMTDEASAAAVLAAMRKGSIADLQNAALSGADIASTSEVSDLMIPKPAELNCMVQESGVGDVQSGDLPPLPPPPPSSFIPTPQCSKDASKDTESDDALSIDLAGTVRSNGVRMNEHSGVKTESETVNLSQISMMTTEGKSGGLLEPPAPTTTTNSHQDNIGVCCSHCRKSLGGEKSANEGWGRVLCSECHSAYMNEHVSGSLQCSCFMCKTPKSDEKISDLGLLGEAPPPTTTQPDLPPEFTRLKLKMGNETLSVIEGPILVQPPVVKGQYECTFCGKGFITMAQRRRHQEWVCPKKLQSGPCKYSCEQCGNSFPVQSSLKKHIARVHGWANMPVEQVLACVKLPEGLKITPCNVDVFRLTKRTLNQYNVTLKIKKKRIYKAKTTTMKPVRQPSTESNSSETSAKLSQCHLDKCVYVDLNAPMPSDVKPDCVCKYCGKVLKKRRIKVAHERKWCRKNPAATRSRPTGPSRTTGPAHAPLMTKSLAERHKIKLKEEAMMKLKKNKEKTIREILQKSDGELPIDSDIVGGSDLIQDIPIPATPRSEINKEDKKEEYDGEGMLIVDLEADKTSAATSVVAATATTAAVPPAPPPAQGFYVEQPLATTAVTTEQPTTTTTTAATTQPQPDQSQHGYQQQQLILEQQQQQQQQQQINNPSLNVTTTNTTSNIPQQPLATTTTTPVTEIPMVMTQEVVVADQKTITQAATTATTTQVVTNPDLGITSNDTSILGMGMQGWTFESDEDRRMFETLLADPESTEAHQHFAAKQTAQQQQPDAQPPPKKKKKPSRPRSQSKKKKTTAERGDEKSGVAEEKKEATTTTEGGEPPLTLETVKPGCICEFCGKLFKQRRIKVTHQKRYCQKNPRPREKYQCETCQKRVYGKIAMENHHRLKHNQTAYICENCETVYLSFTQLDEHCRNEHKLMPYTCEYCDKKVFGPRTFERHRYAHARQENDCDVCQTKIVGLRAMEEHHRTKHCDLPFMCEFCGDTLYWLKIMENHRLAHMNGDIEADNSASDSAQDDQDPTATQGVVTTTTTTTSTQPSVTNPSSLATTSGRTQTIPSSLSSSNLTTSEPTQINAQVQKSTTSGLPAAVRATSMTTTTTLTDGTTVTSTKNGVTTTSTTTTSASGILSRTPPRAKPKNKPQSPISVTKIPPPPPYDTLHMKLRDTPAALNKSEDMTPIRKLITFKDTVLYRTIENECDKCHRIFDYKLNCQKHQEKDCDTNAEVTTRRIWQCRFCEKTYAFATSCYKHMMEECKDYDKEADNALLKFPCSQCNKVFMAALSLRGHILSKHAHVPDSEEQGAQSSQSRRRSATKEKKKKPVKVETSMVSDATTTTTTTTISTTEIPVVQGVAVSQAQPQQVLQPTQQQLQQQLLQQAQSQLQLSQAQQQPLRQPQIQPSQAQIQTKPQVIQTVTVVSKPIQPATTTTTTTAAPQGIPTQQVASSANPTAPPPPPQSKPKKKRKPRPKSPGDRRSPGVVKAKDPKEFEGKDPDEVVKNILRSLGFLKEDDKDDKSSDAASSTASSTPASSTVDSIHSCQNQASTKTEVEEEGGVTPKTEAQSSTATAADISKFNVIQLAMQCSGLGDLAVEDEESGEVGSSAQPTGSIVKTERIGGQQTQTASAPPTSMAGVSASASDTIKSESGLSIKTEGSQDEDDDDDDDVSLLSDDSDFEAEKIIAGPAMPLEKLLEVPIKQVPNPEAQGAPNTTEGAPIKEEADGAMKTTVNTAELLSIGVQSVVPPISDSPGPATMGVTGVTMDESIATKTETDMMVIEAVNTATSMNTEPAVVTAVAATTAGAQTAPMTAPTAPPTKPSRPPRRRRPSDAPKLPTHSPDGKLIVRHMNIPMYKLEEFICKGCCKLFEDKATCEQHLPFCTPKEGNNPELGTIAKYQCYHCDDKFHTKNSCRKHQITVCFPRLGIRLEDSEYSCHLCEKKFHAKYTFSYHLKSVHNIINHPALPEKVFMPTPNGMYTTQTSQDSGPDLNASESHSSADSGVKTPDVVQNPQDAGNLVGEATTNMAARHLSTPPLQLVPADGTIVAQAVAQSNVQAQTQAAQVLPSIATVMNPNVSVDQHSVMQLQLAQAITSCEASVSTSTQSQLLQMPAMVSTVNVLTSGSADQSPVDATQSGQDGSQVQMQQLWLLDQFSPGITQSADGNMLNITHQSAVATTESPQLAGTESSDFSPDTPNQNLYEQTVANIQSRMSSSEQQTVPVQLLQYQEGQTTTTTTHEGTSTDDNVVAEFLRSLQDPMQQQNVMQGVISATPETASSEPETTGQEADQESPEPEEDSKSSDQTGPGCDKCGRVFVSQDVLVYHQKYSCPAKFGNLNSMDDRQCRYCKATFHHKVALKWHMSKCQVAADGSSSVSNAQTSTAESQASNTTATSTTTSTAPSTTTTTATESSPVATTETIAGKATSEGTEPKKKKKKKRKKYKPGEEPPPVDPIKEPAKAKLLLTLEIKTLLHSSIVPNPEDPEKTAYRCNYCHRIHTRTMSLHSHILTNHPEKYRQVRVRGHKVCDDRADEDKNLSDGSCSERLEEIMSIITDKLEKAKAEKKEKQKANQIRKKAAAAAAAAAGNLAAASTAKTATIPTTSTATHASAPSTTTSTSTTTTTHHEMVKAEDVVGMFDASTGKSDDLTHIFNEADLAVIHTVDDADLDNSEEIFTKLLAQELADESPLHHGSGGHHPHHHHQVHTSQVQHQVQQASETQHTVTETQVLTQSSTEPDQTLQLESENQPELKLLHQQDLHLTTQTYEQQELLQHQQQLTQQIAQQQLEQQQQLVQRHLAQQLEQQHQLQQHQQLVQLEQQQQQQELVELEQHQQQQLQLEQQQQLAHQQLTQHHITEQQLVQFTTQYQADSAPPAQLLTTSSPNSELQAHSPMPSTPQPSQISPQPPSSQVPTPDPPQNTGETKAFICSICEYNQEAFASEFSLKCHQKWAHGEKVAESVIETLISNVSSEEDPSTSGHQSYVCPLCTATSLVFNKRVSLECHMQWSHNCNLEEALKQAAINADNNLASHMYDLPTTEQCTQQIQQVMQPLDPDSPVYSTTVGQGSGSEESTDLPPHPHRATGEDALTESTTTTSENTTENKEELLLVAPPPPPPPTQQPPQQQGDTGLVPESTPGSCSTPADSSQGLPPTILSGNNTGSAPDSISQWSLDQVKEESENTNSSLSEKTSDNTQQQPQIPQQIQQADTITSMDGAEETPSSSSTQDISRLSRTLRPRKVNDATNSDKATVNGDKVPSKVLKVRLDRIDVGGGAPPPKRSKIDADSGVSATRELRKRSASNADDDSKKAEGATSPRLLRKRIKSSDANKGENTSKKGPTRTTTKLKR